MTSAFRCCRCGQFRDGAPARVVEWRPTEPFRMNYEGLDCAGSIDLCPTCAPEVLAPLVEIARTKHGKS